MTLAPTRPPAAMRKSPIFRPFTASPLGQHYPRACPPQPRPNLGRPRPFLRPPGCASCTPGPELGEPFSIEKVARLIGCSPWTVRHTLIPRGLPHFRFKASGRLIFYRDQIIRWIERQQQGGM